MPQFLDSTGQVIYLGREIGRGGEGIVYEVAGKPDVVAKIYHEPISDDKAEKLRQMVALSNEKLLRLTAWVVEILHVEPDCRVAGFLMPKINSGAAIHELYNPKSRCRIFPEADWRFLIHAGANLARAFSIIHQHNHAVGDVNHGNVVIAHDATIRLIDCDSYHLNAPTKSFYCEVGVSTHTPPELQGKTLRDVARTANHDNFGLAVLIFQLLFMGRHPFSGAYLGDGESSLEQAIAENRFAYGDALERKMRQPPGTLPLTAIPQNIAALFEQAFLHNENRPAAREWIAALEELTGNLRNCAANAKHFFYRELKECPWCELEAVTGVLFFPVRMTKDFNVNEDFDLVTFERLIENIKPPDLPAALTNGTMMLFTTPVKMVSSTELQNKITRRNIRLNWLLFAVFVMTVFLTISAPTFVIFLLILCLYAWGAILRAIDKSLYDETDAALEKARTDCYGFTKRIEKNTLLKPFELTRDNLRTAARELHDLPQRKTKKVEAVILERRQTAFDVYLRQFSLRKENPAKLSNEQLESLKAAGIKTAYEVTPINFAAPNLLLNVADKQKLFQWRLHLDKEFASRRTFGIALKDRQEIEEEFADARASLAAKVRSGLGNLQQVAAQINKSLLHAQTESDVLFKNFSQAESDLQRVEGLRQRAYVWLAAAVICGLLLGILVNFRLASAPSGFFNRSGNPPPTFVRDNIVQQVDVDEPVGLLSEKSKKFYDEGELNYANEQYLASIEAFRQALKYSPQSLLIHSRLGDALMSAERYNEAANVYQAALKLKEDYANRYNLAVCYYKTGKIKLARKQQIIIRQTNNDLADTLQKDFDGVKITTVTEKSKN